MQQIFAMQQLISSLAVIMARCSSCAPSRPGRTTSRQSLLDCAGCSIQVQGMAAGPDNGTLPRRPVQPNEWLPIHLHAVLIGLLFLLTTEPHAGHELLLSGARALLNKQSQQLHHNARADSVFLHNCRIHGPGGTSNSSSTSPQLLPMQPQLQAYDCGAVSHRHCAPVATLDVIVCPKVSPERHS